MLGLSCSIWDLQSSLQPVEPLVAAHGIYFPDQGLNLGRLPWECGVLATEPPTYREAPTYTNYTCIFTRVVSFYAFSFIAFFFFALCIYLVIIDLFFILYLHWMHNLFEKLTIVGISVLSQFHSYKQL